MVLVFEETLHEATLGNPLGFPRGACGRRLGAFGVTLAGADLAFGCTLAGSWASWAYPLGFPRGACGRRLGAGVTLAGADLAFGRTLAGADLAYGRRSDSSTSYQVLRRHFTSYMW